MPVDPWLPFQNQLTNGTQTTSIEFSGNNWQIYGAESGEKVLVAKPDLAERWLEKNLLSPENLLDYSFGKELYKIIIAPPKHILKPLTCGCEVGNKEMAKDFFLSFSNTRRLLPDVSLHDAIFVEHLQVLFPAYSQTGILDDSTVMGFWLTGGVHISISDKRRLSSLVSWISIKELSELIETVDSTHNNKTASLEQQSTARQERKNSNFDLPGRPKLQNFFNDHIIDVINNRHKYSAMGISSPAGIILHGPPGCGKTYAVERLAEFIGWPCFSINSNTVGSSFIHQTSKNIAQIFEKAIKNAPSIMIIDEMEAFLSHREGIGSSNLHHVEEVAEFLRRIPEAIDKNVLIIGMTNMIGAIDPAILRRGRFDHIIEVEIPTKIEISALLDHLLAEKPKDMRVLTKE